MKIKAIIFDLDGTLVDSIKDIANAMNKVLNEMNLEEHSYSKYNYLAGSGIKNLVINALPESSRTAVNIESAYKKMMLEYEKNLVVESCLYPGISDMLDQISNKNISINIFSNKADVLTQQVAKKLLSAWKFDVIKGTGDIAIKPNAEGVFYISKALSINTKDIVFVGDTDVDMNTAKNAKTKSIGVLWGFRDKEELVSAGANACIEKPLEIIELLD